MRSIALKKLLRVAAINMISFIVDLDEERIRTDPMLKKSCILNDRHMRRAAPRRGQVLHGGAQPMAAVCERNSPALRRSERGRLQLLQAAGPGRRPGLPRGLRCGDAHGDHRTVALRIKIR